MSNELKRVQERLWKKPEPVELSAEKVELALIDDLQKAMQTASKESSAAVGGLSKVSSALDEVFTSYRNAAIYAKQVTDMYSELEAKTKELGLDTPANAKKINDDAANILKFSQDKMKVLQSIRGQLK